ncbi:MAG: HNH endonuclease [Caldilineaceae bacterium]
MADLLAYWRYDNYKRDLEEGAGFNFNSRQPRLHSAVALGDSLWLITGRQEAGRPGLAYYVVARLLVRSKTFNPPGYKYGSYRIWGDLTQSRYYQVGTYEASQLLRGLAFATNKPIGSAAVELAQAFQTMRALTPGDTRLLEAWCRDLPFEPAAYAILPEQQLELAIQQDGAAVDKVIREHQPALAQYRIDRLIEQPVRSRSLSRQVHDLYEGRCQVCGFDPLLQYNVGACEAHHLVYLSRGGEDSLDNLVLLCPNHHTVVHRTNAPFDFQDLTFVFAHNHRERLVLNRHLQVNR